MSLAIRLIYHPWRQVPKKAICNHKVSNTIHWYLNTRQAHTPVLREEVVTCMNPQPGKIYIDMTIGAGGHTKALFELCQDIKVIGLDRDDDALKFSRRLLSVYGSKQLSLFPGKFTDLPSLLVGAGYTDHNVADGILFDVGVSSMQIDDAGRGFSIQRNGALDMRMNRFERTPTAADVVNRLEEKDLYRIIKTYGQEKQARQIARRIVEHRQMLGPITSTKDLQQLIADVYRNNPVEKSVEKSHHPATLTFQALRIFVNDELNELYNGLNVAHRLLKPGGVCAVITFHSLEHTIVRQVFEKQRVRFMESFVTKDLEDSMLFWETDDSIFITPSDTEVKNNSRSRSGQLRIAYKT